MFRINIRAIQAENAANHVLSKKLLPHFLIPSITLALSGCGLLKPSPNIDQDHSFQVQQKIPSGQESSIINTATTSCAPHSTDSPQGKNEPLPKAIEWSNELLGALVGLVKIPPEQTSTLLNNFITQTEAIPSIASEELLNYWTKNLKLAWLWMQAGPYQDELRASQLLDKIKSTNISMSASSSEPQLANIQNLAQLLSVQLQEHIRQHKEDAKKLEQVQQKLDALRTLEKTFAERDRRLGVKP